ncbi:MAG: hypothetical protein NTZ74_11860 [Chloroflexi bacterium]|nr:hypothetical protein [Chloroflexota bacterium]
MVSKKWAMYKKNGTISCIIRVSAVKLIIINIRLDVRQVKIDLPGMEQLMKASSIETEPAMV